MKLNPIAANQTELILDNGDIVFFSYKTPVACWKGGSCYRTDEKFSMTTSKHINQWVGCSDFEYKPQTFFNTLAGEAK